MKMFWLALVLSLATGAQQQAPATARAVAAASTFLATLSPV